MKFNMEKFRELRKKHRWTTKALAEASNISRESISKWENGQREPSPKSLYKLAKTIGIKVSEFSDLEDLYPQSATKVSDTIITDNSNLLDAISNQEDAYLNNILLNLKNMNNNLKRVSNVLRTILLNVNNIIYIKDTDQKYVLVSKAFLDNCSLNVNFVTKGKTDDDFFSQSEAMKNSKEDEKIIASGKVLVNMERHIIGSRKQRWGIINKIPILDSEKRIKGLICVIVDITERKKEEKYSKVLEYAFSQTRTTIWVGQGLDLTNSPRVCKDIIYWHKSEKSAYWENANIDKLSNREFREIWYSSVSDKTRIKFTNVKKDLNYPKTRNYFATSPFNGNRIWIRERIFFDKENETFVGLITEDQDSQKLSLLSNVVNSMSNIIVWSGYYDNENKFHYSYLNNTENITGYNSEDFLNSNIDFGKIVIPEHKELFECLKENSSYPISFEFKINTKIKEYSNIVHLSIYGKFISYKFQSIKFFIKSVKE